MFKKFLKKFSKKNHKIVQETLEIILDSIYLGNDINFSIKMNGKTYSHFEFCGKILVLVFKKGSEEFKLHIFPAVVHVFEGKYGVFAKWFGEVDQKELDNHFEHYLNLIWKKYFKSYHPDLE